MKNLKSCAKVRIAAILAAILAFLHAAPVYATSIQDSILATGTKKLVQDATAWLLVIAPLVTIVAVIYYFIRKSMADEMDQKKWNSRITTAIICGVGAMCASLIINVLMGYYQ